MSRPVIDALGRPQRILLIGGTSDIGLSIVSSLAGKDTEVILAGRNLETLQEAAGELTGSGATAQVRSLDVTDLPAAGPVLDEVFGRDVDIVVIAAGALPVQSAVLNDPQAAQRTLAINGHGAASLLLACHTRMCAQGHGQIVVLSSIAAVRPRPSNFIYGAGKAMVDFLARGLVESPDPRVSVLLVRPGFVRTKMTAGLVAAPFATASASVADAVARWSRRGASSRIIWVPAVLKHVARVMSLLPLALLRKIDR